MLLCDDEPVSRQLTDDEVLLVATGAPFARKFDKRSDLEAEIRRVRVKWKEYQADDFERDKKGDVLKSRANLCHALKLDGITLQYDAFACEKRIFGLPGYGPYLDDAADDALWTSICERHSLKFPRDEFRTFVNVTARENTVHPVIEYLDGLTWDGKPRVAKWTTTYLGAEDNEVNNWIGKTMLVAAVRRVREPGCKFDTMPVFEGDENAGKSSAIRLLCPNGEWYTDNVTFGMDAKKIMEQTAGKWLCEMAEMPRVKKEVEHTKALLSRQVDEERLAYGRESQTETPVHLVGTTNEESNYLVSKTGNRRFLPMKVGTIKLKELVAERDQLWAEAAHLEAQGTPIHASGEMFEALKQVQAEREEYDELYGLAAGELVGTKAISVHGLARKLEFRTTDFTPQLQERLRRALGKCGFKITKKTVKGRRMWERPEGYMDGVALEGTPNGVGTPRRGPHMKCCGCRAFSPWGPQGPLFFSYRAGTAGRAIRAGKNSGIAASLWPPHVPIGDTPPRPPRGPQRIKAQRLQALTKGPLQGWPGGPCHRGPACLAAPGEAGPPRADPSQPTTVG